MEGNDWKDDGVGTLLKIFCVPYRQCVYLKKAQRATAPGSNSASMVHFASCPWQNHSNGNHATA